jgi:hypothetical protein
MPKVTYKQDQIWSNFHRTRMGLHIKSLATIDATDVKPGSGLDRFAATGAALLDHLRTLDVPPGPGEDPMPFAAGTAGQCWSFAPLTGTPVSQFDALGLTGIDMLEATERHPNCKVPADMIALSSGGTTLFDLATWAEARNCTIHTSGTFLPPTVAGSIGTSSHGSRLHYGGIQNMVLGMHLIVGSDEHVWIEPASRPVLSPSGLAKLTIGGKPPRLVRDDDRFEDALVHLGGMGIVNGVAVGLVANDHYSVMQRFGVLTPTFLKHVAAGGFQEIGGQLDCDPSPVFYELTVNPHKLFDDVCANTMYFRTGRVPAVPAGTAELVRPAEVVIELGAQIVIAAHNAPPIMPTGGGAKAAPASRVTGKIPDWVLRLLIGDISVFAYYSKLRTYDTPNSYFDPDDPSAPGPFRWSEMHPGKITGNQPGALYNASFAIPVEQVAHALPLICKAVQKLAPSFVFTVRFVDKADGTLAFTRFEKNAVIEIDGLSPLVCLAAKAQVNPDLSYAPQLKAALDVLAGTVPEGAKLVRKALHDNGIPYSMHWAKLGGLDKAKVYADYGHPRDCESLTHRWRGTRDMLLTPFGKRVFWNQALIDYGLVDP